MHALLLTCVLALALADEMTWLPDYAEARKTAEKLNKPLFVVFR